MSKVKRLGILLIIIGMFIPLVLYPFTSLTTSGAYRSKVYATQGASYDIRIPDLEVVFTVGAEKDEDNKILGIYIGEYDGRLAIPYRYLFAFGTLLAFFGISIVALYKDNSH